MFDTFAQATIANFEVVWQLYVDVCVQQEFDQYGAQWVLGVYPTQDDIRQHLEAGELYVGWIDERPAAAMVLTSREDPAYASVPWPTTAEPQEVAVIHLLAVHPSARGKHLGKELVQEAIRLAREQGKRAIHLDVVPGNLSASRVYEQAGFTHVGTYQIYYVDTGLTDYEMFEYAL